mgnify:CR=1 FL=1
MGLGRDIGTAWRRGPRDEWFAAAKILGNRIVVGARHGIAQRRLHFVDERPVVRDYHLVIEAFALHHIVAELQVPASFAERMNLLAVAVIGRGIAGKFLAIADHFTGAFFKLNVPSAGMIDSFDKAHRPIMSIAIDIHFYLIRNFESQAGSYLQGAVRSTSAITR